MPDASDRIVPTFYSLSPERWERIFGKKDETVAQFTAIHKIRDGVYTRWVADEHDE